VARIALADGLRVASGSIRAAWNGAEALAREQADLFQNAFGVRPHDQYGGRELSTIACQFAADGPLEVLGPDVLVEIVDDDGKPAVPGTPGRLLLTSTACAGTPFLRYEVGDVAVAGAEHIDEGGIRALRSLWGRQSGILRLPDGTKLYNVFWSHLFKDFPEVEQFQVVVRDDGLRIRLKGRGFSAASQTSLLRKLQLLGPGFPIALEWTPTISPTRAGKLLQVVDERSPAESVNPGRGAPSSNAR
jgi:phenylacetate-CoA ligase